MYTIINYIVRYNVFCPVLCSNCGHEDVQWVLETYYVHYNNNGHIDELVFLLIMYLKGSVKRIALRQCPCGIPRVVKDCPFVILFYTCSVDFFFKCYFSEDLIALIVHHWFRTRIRINL